MRFFPAFLVPLFLIGNLPGQEGAPGREPKEVPSDKFRYNRIGVSNPEPNVDLPEHVIARAGELTLFADFENADEEGLPLFLVNRTGKERGFSSQDHDIFVKLEYQSKDGTWVRAQTHHNSFCGNSYYGVSLAPGQFFAFRGYHPPKGVSAKVRFHSSRNSLVSNIGSGFYLEDDRKAASLDDMAAGEIPSVLGWKLRVDKLHPERNRVDIAQYLAALEMLSGFSESHYYRNEAREKIEQLGSETTEAKEIQKILSRHWPYPPKKTDTLVRMSLDNIQQKLHLEISWELIVAAISDHHGFSDPVSSVMLTEIAEELPDALQEKNDQVVKFASDLLRVDSFTNEWISTDRLLEWVRLSDRWVFEASAEALARRGEFAELSLLGLEEEVVDRKVRILATLASGGKKDLGNFYPRRPETDKEREFWKACLENHTPEAVGALPGTYNNHNGYNRVVHGPLKKYLEKVVEEMGSKERKMNDLHKLSRLVKFFGTWKMEENAPVLEALLNHPGYVETEVSSSRDGIYLRRDFRIRRDAKEALFNMKIPVDRGLILEERVPLAGQHWEEEEEEKEDPFSTSRVFGDPN